MATNITVQKGPWTALAENLPNMILQYKQLQQQQDMQNERLAAEIQMAQAGREFQTQEREAGQAFQTSEREAKEQQTIVEMEKRAELEGDIQTLGFTQELYSNLQEELNDVNLILAEKGLTSNELTGLKPIQQTKDAIAVLDKIHEGKDVEAKDYNLAVTSLQKELENKRNRIGAFQQGSLTYASLVDNAGVNKNQDLIIDDKELEAYMKSLEPGVILDPIAFKLGVKFKNPDPAAIKELEALQAQIQATKVGTKLTEQQIKTAELENQYLPQKYKDAETLTKIEIEKGNLSVDEISQSIEIGKEKLAQAKQATALNEIQIAHNNQVLKSEEFKYESSVQEQVMTSIEAQMVANAENVHKLASGLLPSLSSVGDLDFDPQTSTFSGTAVPFISILSMEGDELKKHLDYLEDNYNYAEEDVRDMIMSLQLGFTSEGTTDYLPFLEKVSSIYTNYLSMYATGEYKQLQTLYDSIIAEHPNWDLEDVQEELLGRVSGDSDLVRDFLSFEELSNSGLFNDLGALESIRQAVSSNKTLIEQRDEALLNGSSFYQEKSANVIGTAASDDEIKSALKNLKNE
jgi:predicted Holliday junction resolvase-like endonuclease